MPRHPRLFVPGAIYHVYCRIARGEFVFDDDHEAIEFIEALRRVHLCQVRRFRRFEPKIVGVV
jgi:hypothetical protein